MIKYFLHLNITQTKAASKDAAFYPLEPRKSAAH
jgi:hypothetical protein